MVEDDVDGQVVFVGVGEKDVSDSTVSDGWAKDGDVVLVAPVVDALRVIDFLTQSSDE